jgi:hypothetical protein
VHAANVIRVDGADVVHRVDVVLELGDRELPAGVRAVADGHGAALIVHCGSRGHQPAWAPHHVQLAELAWDARRLTDEQLSQVISLATRLP